MRSGDIHHIVVNVALFAVFHDSVSFAAFLHGDCPT